MLPSLSVTTVPYLLCLPVLGAISCLALGILARYLQARWSLTEGAAAAAARSGAA